MTPEFIDRRALKAQTRETLRSAQVSPKLFTALYLALVLALNVVDSFTGSGALATFASILVTLLAVVMDAGFVLYCMAVRQGERAEYLALFDGFSFAGKIIALNIVKWFFIILWSMLFTIPGIIAAYRYRFALYNLCENPEISVFEAMALNIVKWFFIILWSMLFTIPGIIAAYRYRFALYNLCENPEISVFEAMNMSKRQTLGYKLQLFQLDLSYLGWLFISSLPSLVYSGAAYQLTLQQLMASYGLSPDAGMVASATAVISLLPVWGWTLLIGVWHLAAAIFFLPSYQCVELGYFETAKATSGIGAGAPPRQNAGGWNGPDNLGGL